jgi:hypothetical protein
MVQMIVAPPRKRASKLTLAGPKGILDVSVLSRLRAGGKRYGVVDQ